jgi:O-antigen/teichoic acid export membrane protein
VNNSLRKSVFYSAAVVAAFSCLARPLIVGLFSHEFSSSAELLVLFIPLIAMRSVGAAILPGLIAAEKAGTYARLTMTGAILNFILNIVLIPRYGAHGAVISTLASYLPIEVLGLWSVSRVIPGFWRSGDLSMVLKTAIAVAIVIFSYRRLVPAPADLLSTLIHGCLITAVFAGLLLLTRALSVDEIKDMARPILTFTRKR